MVNAHRAALALRYLLKSRGWTASAYCRELGWHGNLLADRIRDGSLQIQELSKALDLLEISWPYFLALVNPNQPDLDSVIKGWALAESKAMTKLQIRSIERWKV